MLRSGTPFATSLSISGMAEAASLGKNVGGGLGGGGGGWEGMGLGMGE